MNHSPSTARPLLARLPARMRSAAFGVWLGSTWFLLSMAAVGIRVVGTLVLLLATARNAVRL
ncbi:hypothetical protein AS850_16210 [Frondihabitans sp. 762G35]|nr:hypothetical protein AS850_16210 [Frondihabitans sp. 762G35]